MRPFLERLWYATLEWYRVIFRYETSWEHLYAELHRMYSEAQGEILQLKQQQRRDNIYVENVPIPQSVKQRRERERGL